MAKKLASIQKVTSITVIPEADNIEALTLSNGNIVVEKKGKFKEGDRCIYFEVGAQLPKRDEFAFMEKMEYRVTKRNFRGQDSEGMCWTIDILPSDIKNVRQGKDVTSELGVSENKELTVLEKKYQKTKEKLEKLEADYGTLDARMIAAQTEQREADNKVQAAQDQLAEIQKIHRNEKQKITKIERNIRALQEEVMVTKNERFIQETKRGIAKIGAI